MALKLKDGYTIPFATESFVLNINGGKLYEGLPIISGKYRPALFETQNAFEFALARTPSGEAEAKLMADFIAARVTEWDVEYEEKPGGPMIPAPCTAEFILKHLPEPFAGLVLNKVRRWAGEDKAAGN